MDFIVYSKPACPQCDQAKMLIKNKGKSYKEIIIDVGQERIHGVEYIPLSDLKLKYPLVRMAPVIADNDSNFIGSFHELKKLLA
jgi:glutaredoxin